AGRVPGAVVGRVRALVAAARDRGPLAPGLSVESLRRERGVPDGLLAAVLPATGLVVRDGVVVDPRRPSALPDSVERAVRVVQQRLGQDPFTAPEAPHLAELGLGPKQLAAAR